MAWLRVDDGFPGHPKLVRLSRPDRWTWLEVLVYCARYRTGGEVPASIGEALKYATPAFLNRCLELNLLDHSEHDGDAYHVHDWAIYNPKDPTAADRMQRHRDRNAERNDAVTPDRNASVTATVPRAQAAARVPSPSSTSSSVVDPADDEQIEKNLEPLKPTPEQLARWVAAMRSEPERFNACLSAAKAKGRNVAAYLDTLLSNGSYPEREETPTMIDVNEAARRLIAGDGWDETTGEDAIRDDLQRLAHSAKCSGTLDMDAALELWRDERARRYPELAAGSSTAAASGATM